MYFWVQMRCKDTLFLFQLTFGLKQMVFVAPFVISAAHSHRAPLLYPTRATAEIHRNNSRCTMILIVNYES